MLTHDKNSNIMGIKLSRGKWGLLKMNRNYLEDGVKQQG